MIPYLLIISNDILNTYFFIFNSYFTHYLIYPFTNLLFVFIIIIILTYFYYRNEDWTTNREEEVASTRKNEEERLKEDRVIEKSREWISMLFIINYSLVVVVW